MKVIAVTLAATAAWFAASPAPVTTAPPPPFGSEWTVDPVHSSVVFKIKHAGTAWFYGVFKDVSGTVTLDDKPENIRIAVKVATDSIDTRNADRDKHVKGPDLFDSKQFPEMAFTSTKVQKDGDLMVVDGELSLHGQKKPLSLKVAKTGEGEMMGKRQGFETTFQVKRSDFGIKSKQADAGLSDEVVLTVSLECVQAAKK
jgi:polyisoprenoid-binding protein YceI